MQLYVVLSFFYRLDLLRQEDVFCHNAHIMPRGDVSRETLLAALWFAVLDFDGAVYVERDGDLDEEECGEEEEGGG